MKRAITSRIPAYILFVLAFFIAFSTSAADVMVKFKIVDEAGQVVKGATVKLFNKNKLVMVDENAPAVTKWALEESSYYTIEVSLQGFITKRIGFYTQFDENTIIDDKYSFFIELESNRSYDMYTHAEDVLDYPAAIVEFQPESGVFDFNEQYWLSTRRSFLQMKNAQAMAE